MASASLDAPILKGVGEAVRALAALQKMLNSIVPHMPASVAPDKAKAAALKVRKFLGLYAPMTKIAGSRIFDELSPEAQKGVLWTDSVIADLMKVEDALRAAAKTADLDVAKDPAKAMKQIKAAAKQAGNPPWATGTIAKVERELKVYEGQKSKLDSLGDFLSTAQKIGGVEGNCLSALGLVILLHWILRYLKDKASSAPKT
jgi:hypothetical protein